MSLSGEVYRRLARVSARGDVPGTPAGQTAAMERAYGSARAAREALGVSESTWRRWAKGTGKPGRENAPRLAQAAQRAVRRARLSAGREKRIRAVQTGPGHAGVRQTVVGGDRWIRGVYVHGTVVVSEDERPRVIDLTPYLHPGAMGRVVDTYLAGGDPARTLLAQLDTDTQGGRFYRTLLAGTDPAHRMTVTRVEF